MKPLVCKICNEKNNANEIKVREMMFGLRDEFIYLQCPHCHCLQLSDPPADMSRYYPGDYYSYKVPHFELSYLKEFRFWMKKVRLGALKEKPGYFSQLLVILFGMKGIPIWLQRLFPYLEPDSSILDVGSGSGDNLITLWHLGFHNLTGSDFYIPKTINFNDKFSIRKEKVSDIVGFFDMIMLHHSLEHMENQQEVFTCLSEKMTDRSILIIRVPTVDSFAWVHYQENWVQIDAPRHYFLHSIKSLQYLAESCKMEIFEMFFDSTGFQFYGSEQYKMDISLMDPRSFYMNKKSNLFTKQQIISFDEKADFLNKQGRGDQLCIFLRRKIHG